MESGAIPKEALSNNAAVHQEVMEKMKKELEEKELRVADMTIIQEIIGKKISQANAKNVEETDEDHKKKEEELAEKNEQIKAMF